MDTDMKDLHNTIGIPMNLVAADVRPLHLNRGKVIPTGRERRLPRFGIQCASSLGEFSPVAAHRQIAEAGSPLPEFLSSHFKLENAVQPLMNTDGHGYQAPTEKQSRFGIGTGGQKAQPEIRVYPCASVVCLLRPIPTAKFRFRPCQLGNTPLLPGEGYKKEAALAGRLL